MFNSRRSVLLAASVVSLFSLRAHAAGTLTWDASGTSPTNPQDGTGIWSTTAALWSNGTADIGWINDGTEYADIGNYGSQGGTITVGSTINAAGVVSYTYAGTPDTIAIVSGGQLNLTGDIKSNTITPQYPPTISVNGGTLNMMGHNLIDANLSINNGTVENINSYTSPPQTFLFAVGPAFRGYLNIAGTNNFSNPIDMSSSESTVHLLAGATLGNTRIDVGGGSQFIADTGTSAGSTGPGTAGVSLVTSSLGATLQSTLTIGGNGTAGTVTLNQQSGYTGNGLSLGGGIENFYLTPTGSSELVDNGAAAAVTNVNQINLLPDGGLTSLTVGDTYTLISDPTGGLTGTFQFSNGTNTEAFNAGAYSYTVRLNDTATAVTVTVVPEPATISAIGIGVLALAQRRRRTAAKGN